MGSWPAESHPPGDQVTYSYQVSHHGACRPFTVKASPPTRDMRRTLRGNVDSKNAEVHLCCGSVERGKEKEGKNV